MMFKGRRKITTSFKAEDVLDQQSLITLLNTSRAIHLENKLEIEYLIEYKKGNQPILYKEKLVRPEINNSLVINHAQMTTRNIIGYFLGSPIQYIQSGANNKDQIDYLNRILAYEDKYVTDKEIGEYQSITGTAYRIIYTDGAYGDEVPFEEKALHPATTYVVYENSISEKPVVGVTYHDLTNAKNAVIGTKIYAYTMYGVFDITTKRNGLVDINSEIVFTQYNVGGVPIIEYPNNMWRIGDWELCMGLMNAINNIHSGRIDDIDQVVQSLVIFVNADIDEERYEQMRELGVVMLNNKTGLGADVKTIQNQLDQTGMNMFAEELEALLYAMLGIPDRQGRSGGGGDTGQAVELRDGWADLEIIARNKELTFKRSEKQTLRIILNILNNKLGTKISLLDIDIKFSRNKTNNMLVKTQSYSMLLSTKTLSPADCLTIVDLVSDVNEYIARGESFWGEDFGNPIPKPPELNEPDISNAADENIEKESVK